MKRVEYIALGTQIVSPILIGRDVLEVSVDGIGRSKLIEIGTPIDQEVKYDSSTGTLTFPQSLNGEKVFVLYQDA